MPTEPFHHMRMAGTSQPAGGRDFSIMVMFPNIPKAIAHISVEQDHLVAFLRDAEKLWNDTQSMYDEAKLIVESRRNTLTNLVCKIRRMQKKYGLPEELRPLSSTSDDIPLAEKIPVPRVGAKKEPKHHSEKPKVLSIEKVSPKRAQKYKSKLMEKKQPKGQASKQQASASKTLWYENVYSDSEEDDTEILVSQAKTPMSKKVQIPISKYVSRGLSNILAHQSQASTSGIVAPEGKPKSVEEQIVAWNKRLANIYSKPDPRVPLHIFLPQAGAHRAKSDPLYGKFESIDLKSWVEWNHGHPWLNIERFRDDGGRYTDITDPNRQLTVDRRLILPATWKKHHKRLETAITFLEAKLQVNQPHVVLENIEDTMSETCNVSYQSEVTVDMNQPDQQGISRKRRRISTDEEEYISAMAEVAEVDRIPKPQPSKRTARKSFPRSQPMGIMLQIANTSSSLDIAQTMAPCGHSTANGL